MTPQGILTPKGLPLHCILVLFSLVKYVTFFSVTAETTSGLGSAVDIRPTCCGRRSHNIGEVPVSGVE